LKAFNDTVNALRRQMGRDIRKWRWGNVHKIEFKHPFGYLPFVGRIFNIGPFPASGAEDTINQMLCRSGKLPYAVQAGPSTRRLIDFGEPGRQLDVLPTGNSGNFMSPNYADQTGMFMSGQYHDSEDQIRAHKRHEMHFLPAAEMVLLR
jgi:penicillin amidase